MTLQQEEPLLTTPRDSPHAAVKAQCKQTEDQKKKKICKTKDCFWNFLLWTLLSFSEFPQELNEKMEGIAFQELSFPCLQNSRLLSATAIGILA